MRLISHGKNANTVVLGNISMLFSYEALVAFKDTLTGRRLVNPTYRDFSPTTTAHLNAQGFKDAPDAPTGSDFALALTDAFKETANA